MNNQEGRECVCVREGGSRGEELKESLMRLKRVKKQRRRDWRRGETEPFFTLNSPRLALGAVLLQSHPFDYSQRDC